MYVLDTCIVRYWAGRRSRYPKLFDEMERTPTHCLNVSIITVVEISEGALELIARARATKNDEEIALALRRVGAFWAGLQGLTVLPYDELAHQQYMNLRASRALARKPITRKKEKDFRIAAVALSRGFTVITANVSDFVGIEGLTVTDWTR